MIFLALLLLYVQTSAQHYVFADRFDGAALYADVVHYVKLGIHRTGTEGDNKTSEWIKGILDKNGFKTEYVTFPVKQFFPEKTQLTVGGKALEVFPVWPVANPNVQLTGALVDAQNGTEVVKDKIVWISQVSKERSFSFLDQDNAKVIKKFIDLGAKAIVLIADNAAGEIAAINTSPGDSWAVPVVQLAPKDLPHLKDGATASLNIRGELREVTARNIQGTIGSGEKTVIISTPISGWFTCGGERGPGIATFNALAKWVAEKKLPYKFIFTGNSGHELAQHQGTHIFLHQKAPKPEDVRLWFHLGASFATHNYVKTAGGVAKRPEADGNRIVYYSGDFSKPLDEAFKNVKINKAPDKAYGELVVAQQKGYSRFIGLVGTASFALFHTPLDDASTTSPKLLEEMANAVKDAIELELARDQRGKP